MEDFTKMVEAYRWRGEEFHTKKQHRDPCASLCASPAPATHFNEEAEQTGHTSVCCSDKKNLKGCFSSPNTSCQLTNGSSTGSQSAGRDVHRQNNRYESKISISDDDGDVGSQGTLDRALSYSSGSYSTGQICHRKKKSQASSRGLSSRQLVFSAEDVDAKGDLKGRINSRVKCKKERKKSGQVQGKQRETAVTSMHGTVENYIPELYDDSACEDGPIEFFSPDMADSPGVASQPSHVEASNMPASKKKRRCSATPSICVPHRHVLMNGKSPFFAHVLQTPNSKHAKKIKKTLSSIPSEDEGAKVKVYSRRRKKACPVLVKDVNTIESNDYKDVGHLADASEWKDRIADSSEEAVTCVNAAAPPRKATSKAKTSAYFTAVVKALGQREIANKTWVPPISVYALIQEELYRDPWKVLVACMLLNKTGGGQMRKVIWDLFALCPTPEAAAAVETEKIEDIIWPLGLQKKRARMIQRFSKDYLGKEWVHVGELHGIGKYATDAYAIFCEGRWQEVQPEDHKLVDYWRYLCATDGLGYAFKDDREKSCEEVCTAAQAEI